MFRSIKKKSKRNINATFSGLLTELQQRKNIEVAVKSLQNSSAGPDGYKRNNYICSNSQKIDETFITKIQNRVVNKNFSLGTPRIDRIKPKNRYRYVSIYNLEDRVIMQLFALIIEAIYSPCFAEGSIAYQKGKSEKWAKEKILEQSKKITNGLLMKVDIENFFPTINRKILLDMLCMKIKDDDFIEALAELLDVTTKEESVGIELGSALACNLSNVFLHYTCDMFLNQYCQSDTTPYYKLSFIRYADDIAIIGEDDKGATYILQDLIGLIAKVDLNIKSEKTVWQAFGFKHPDLRYSKYENNFFFLGREYYWKKNTAGRLALHITTPKSSIKQKLKDIKNKLKKNLKDSSIIFAIQESTLQVKGFLEFYFTDESKPNRLRAFARKARSMIMDECLKKNSYNWDLINNQLEYFKFPVI